MNQVVQGLVPGSFRDPSGFIFHREGTLFRQVNISYAFHYDRLIDSGLYGELTEEGLLVPHLERPSQFAAAPEAYRVLEPELIPFISYPYEWCFGQLKDAALTTLEIQRRALARDMFLKDCSAYNIQFKRGRPILIDTLSFETYREGEPWIAYRQFCQHFLAPLLLMSKVDVRLGKLLASHIDGLPLDLTSRLLPRKTWLRGGTLLHVHLHAKSLRKYSNTTKPLPRSRRMSRTGLEGLVSSLEGAVRRLQWEPEGTEWADYAKEHGYAEGALTEKERVVDEFLQRTSPRIVWDLGANVGRFSRIAAGRGAHVIAIDGDPAALERLYRKLREQGEGRILPLWIDLSNPTAGVGWAGEERSSLMERGPADLVLALALIHHLAISNNIPLDALARFLGGLGRSLVVEFVPKEDEQVQRMLRSREDIFSNYTQEGFESALSKCFRIQEARPIAGTPRRLYLMTRREA